MFDKDQIEFFGGIFLNKSYGKKEVLQSVNFSVPIHGIVGLFGLNGAGKSTLFRILSGLDGEYKGSVYKKDFEDVAYMAVDRTYPAEMRVKDLVEFQEIFFEKQQTLKIYENLEEMQIDPYSFMFALSSGQRQYVKFLLTIYSGASVCLFDEPMSNLDVVLRDKIAKTMIMEINEQRLFMIATHEIKEFERLIDGFYILKKGILSPYFDCEEVVSQTEKSVEDFYREYAYETN